MNIVLTPLHYIYLIFIFIIIAAMVKKRDISLICIIGIFLLGLVGTSSVYHSTIGVFNSFIYATTIVAMFII